VKNYGVLLNFRISETYRDRILQKIKERTRYAWSGGPWKMCDYLRDLIERDLNPVKMLKKSGKRK